MRNTAALIISLLFASLFMTSCEVEFSPNAEWKEIPVVYCLLDQDDDTTWARVERCYLGDGSIYSYSGISDSINYPVGTIAISLVKIRDGVETVYPFRDTVIDRQSGDFASTAQPIYFLPGKGHFDDYATYDIRVVRVADGMLLAHAQQPIQLIVRNSDDSVFTKPNYTYNAIQQTYRGMFSFKSSGNTCQIEWPALENARLYQPFVRFYYAVDDDGDGTREARKYIDIRTPSMSSINGADRYTLYYGASAFLTNVKEQLKDDPRPKAYLKEVELYLTACSEDFSAYMSNVADAGNLDQSRELYTNIEGGRGIFAARRTSLHRWYPADSSVLPNPPGLFYQLKQLQVGF